MSERLPQCEALTQRRAWNNPLAPLARCKSKAVATVTSLNGEQHQVCNRHGKARLFVPPGSHMQTSR